MLSIIYPYRERDLDRIRFSLNSLTQQVNKEFKVYFVDYGSSQVHANKVKTLLNNYNFVRYSYHYTECQPWNKSRALNSIIKKIDTNYFFVADIDIIFHPNFIEVSKKISETNQIWYFKVGFLTKKASKVERPFKAYNVKFESNKEATGLTLCPVAFAKNIHGFDEFYHFWGSEDTDFHVRLKNAGHTVNFYNSKLLLLHKWHKNYKSRDLDKLTKELKVTNVVRLNSIHLKTAILKNRTIIKQPNWGNLKTQKDDEILNNDALDNTYEIITVNKDEVDYFIHYTLNNLEKNRVYKFLFKKKCTQLTLKNKIKSILNKNKVLAYTLKQVNDLVLMQLINSLPNANYSFRVNPDKKTIELSIQVKI